MNREEEAHRFLPGSECLIEALGDDRAVSQRLSEMGVLPGSHLQVIRVSPLGGTLEIRVDDSETLAVRLSDLEQLRCRFTALPLSTAAGRFTAPLRVRALLGGRGFRERMQRKQIVPGQPLQVLESTPHRVRVIPGHSPVPVELGAGEAAKIIVEPVPDTASGGTPEKTSWHPL